MKENNKISGINIIFANGDILELSKEKIKSLAIQNIKENIKYATPTGDDAVSIDYEIAEDVVLEIEKKYNTEYNFGKSGKINIFDRLMAYPLYKDGKVISTNPVYDITIIIIKYINGIEREIFVDWKDASKNDTIDCNKYQINEIKKNTGNLLICIGKQYKKNKNCKKCKVECSKYNKKFQKNKK